MTIVTFDNQDIADVSDWLTHISAAYNVHVRAGWEFVDVLRDGIDRFGGKDRHAVAELYELASQQIGLSVGTLQNYVSIARAFPLGRRVGELGITHHMAVRGLPDGLQEELLDDAVSNGLSAETLRYEARKHMPNFANIDISETSNKSSNKITNGDGANGHSQAVATYEQLADDLAGDESGYDWTDEAPITPEAITYFDGSPVAPSSSAQVASSDEYYTPAYIIDAARSVLGHIDLDPASCERAQEVVQADVYYSKSENGLDKVWGGNVWINPPFSEPKPFVFKLIEEYEAGNVESAIILTNNSTETQWGQALLSRYPVCFVGASEGRRSRISFWKETPDKPEPSNRYSQMIFYIGKDAQKFFDVFSQFGPILEKK